MGKYIAFMDWKAPCKNINSFKNLKNQLHFSWNWTSALLTYTECVRIASLWLKECQMEKSTYDLLGNSSI